MTIRGDAVPHKIDRSTLAGCDEGIRMHIYLPDRIPAAELPEEVRIAMTILEKEGLSLVADVRITLRIFNEDDRECYPADESGHHGMGFTMKRSGTPSDRASTSREISWQLPGMKPDPVEHEGLRALWDLFPQAKSHDD